MKAYTNKKCQVVYYIVICLLLFFACSNRDEEMAKSTIVKNPKYGRWQDRGQFPIDFKMEMTFGSKSDRDGYLFSGRYNIVGPVVDPMGNVYVLDNVRNRLLSFDLEGNLRWITGEEGRGPGDLLKVRGIAINDTALFIGNIKGSRLDQYDLQGNYIRSLPLESKDLILVQVEGFLNNGLLVTSSVIWGEYGNRVTVFDISDTLKKVSQFDVKVLKDVEIGKGLNATLDISIFDSLIALGNYRDYAIKFYNKKGQNVKIITRDFEKLVRPGVVNNASNRSMQTLGNLSAPIELEKGYFLTTLYWPIGIDDPDEFARKALYASSLHVEFSSSIDLFKSNGTLLFTEEKEGQWLPDIGKITYVDSNGYLYTIKDNPYPQIVKYKVTVVEKY